MGTYWKCKNCGKINMDYVGTCSCGGLKSDGEAATEEEYKNQMPEKDIPKDNKRKWKCPNCSKVNEGDFCSCGYVKSRFDKYLDEETDTAPQINNVSGSGKSKKIIVTIAVIFAIVMGANYLITGSFRLGGSKVDGTYLKTYGVNNYESERYILKNGKYEFYLYGHMTASGSYKYDRDNKTVTIRDENSGAERVLYYGEDSDGDAYLARELSGGRWEFCYKYK